MAGLLADLKASIDSALVGELSPATYWRSEQVGSTPLNEPIYDWVSYPCEGIRGTFDVLLTGTGTVPLDAAKIEILASSLSIPVLAGDRINIDDSWWSISRIELDPAGAWWTLQCGESADPT